MQKQLKFNNLILLAISFLIIGFGGNIASASNPVVDIQKPQVKNEVVSITNKLNKADSVKTIPEKNLYALNKLKKTDHNSKLFKFAKAMILVLVSSLIIFIALKIYKKRMLQNISKQDNIDYSKNLESPKDFREAINLFIDKTDKQ